MKPSFLRGLSELIERNRIAGETHLKAWREEMERFTPPQDTERDRHYDRNGYCDNPSRGY